MITHRRFRFVHVWMFAWKNIARVAALASLVWAGYDFLGWNWLAIPFLPIATIGTAVAFYVGFKNNSSYDRLWEARKIWGSIVNTTRAWASETCAVVGHPQVDANPEEVATEVARLVRRQLAWINVLRLQLRRPSPLNGIDPKMAQIRVAEDARAGEGSFDEEIERVLGQFVVEGERERVRNTQNMAAGILHEHFAQLIDLKRRGWIDDFEHSDLKQHPLTCLNSQGAAERIKTFPFPRQYANFSLIFVNLFSAMLPFGLINQVNQIQPDCTWLIVPFSVLISWVFYSMEQVGDASENPFEGGVNDVPMSAICRNLEIELRSALGETELPERLDAVDGILL